MQTEYQDPELLDLDLRESEDLIALMLETQQRALDSVRAVQEPLALAVDAAASRLNSGEGRLIYAGAGTSGRLAVQDGAELWATYGWPAERLHVAMAGGDAALKQSLEGVEDDAAAAAAEVAALQLTVHDVVLAVAASGRSPWTCRFAEAARGCGALSITLANNAGAPLLALGDHALLLDSGREVLAGSTRMAAGTAQKICLNLFSSSLMIRLGRTYGNLLVDMAARNDKLEQRRVRMVDVIVPGCETEVIKSALRAHDQNVKLAVLSLRGLSAVESQRLLQQVQGRLRAALEWIDAS